MPKNRLEAFTDAVIAIIMTILVLELTAPEEATFEALWALRYRIIIYVLSFISLAIYWVNHHHLFQLAKRINGKILWLNIALLLFLSLFPLTTAWVDEHLTETAPEITYGIVMLLADIFYALLARTLCKMHPDDSDMEQVLGSTKKSRLTILIVSCGIILGIWLPPAVVIACAISLVFWIIPDRRIEQLFSRNTNTK